MASSARFLSVTLLWTQCLKKVLLGGQDKERRWMTDLLLAEGHITLRVEGGGQMRVSQVGEWGRRKRRRIWDLLMDLRQVPPQVRSPLP